MPQLRLGFRDENDSPPALEPSPARVVPCSQHNIEQVTQSLRPRILDYLRAAETRVGLRELRQVLGFPVVCTEQNPLDNPVNRILKEMRDAGEIACREFERGEPVFSLRKNAESEAAGGVAVPAAGAFVAREPQGREGMDSLAQHHRPQGPPPNGHPDSRPAVE